MKTALILSRFYNMDKSNLVWQKIYSKFPALVFDTLAVPIAWVTAFWLRNDMVGFPMQARPIHLAWTLPVLLVTQILSYYYFKVYRGLWRFSSLSDVVRVLKAVTCTTMLASSLFYFMPFSDVIPSSIYPLYALTLISLLCGGRLLVRAHIGLRYYHPAQAHEKKTVLIIGAGQAGEGLVRDLIRMNEYTPIGFLDDSFNKVSQEVHGVRVLGRVQDLPLVLDACRIDLIFIAIPSARSITMRRIVTQCELTGIPFRTLPSMHALASGQVEVNALREVSIEDLLGRDQVALNWDKISDAIGGKRIVVTGGGGSIGMELCRQIAALAPSCLLIIDNSEFNLYKIDLELAERFPLIKRQLALVSVADATAVNQVFSRFKPHMVFHAAAYKHVPMLEHQIRVAVQNNILGTQIVAEASVEAGVSKFILISTDKAVNPTNIMGTTKRVAELFCQNMDAHVHTQFITVRFGNVLGSAGSVVPLFQKQLQAGGPLTVTHPDIQRYFMTIPEASQLILQAMVNGEGGEIFVLDMGEPIKINYLAELMIRLAGKEPKKDIKIHYTGLRPGEKLFEELFHPSEQLAKTDHEKLFKARVRQIDWNELKQSFRLLQAACSTHQDDELFVILSSLVPEFRCQSLEESEKNAFSSSCI